MTLLPMKTDAHRRKPPWLPATESLPVCAGKWLSFLTHAWGSCRKHRRQCSTEDPPLVPGLLEAQQRQRAATTDDAARPLEEFKGQPAPLGPLRCTS